MSQEAEKVSPVQVQRGKLVNRQAVTQAMSTVGELSQVRKPSVLDAQAENQMRSL